MKSIPLLDLAKEYAFLKKDIDIELKRCFKSHAWVLGEKVDQFEEAAARYLGSPYAVGVASGTDALLLSLHALALKRRGSLYFDKKDEVITTPFTFIATAEAIVRAGATPVFVDVDPQTYTIDPHAVAAAVTKKTVGIIPVHLFGQAAQMAPLIKTAREHKLFVVEDAAQAFGAQYRDRKLGTLADAGCFSFFPSKTLGAYGDAGMITTNNKKLALIIRSLRNHGQNRVYNAGYIGFNSRLDSIQAAVLLAKLKHIDSLNEKRRKAARAYDELLAPIRGIKPPQKPVSLTEHVYSLYTVTVKKGRDELCSYFNSCGIASRVYYPVLLNSMKAFTPAKAGGKLTNARRLTRSVLSLPVHPFLSHPELAYIQRKAQTFFQTG